MTMNQKNVNLGFLFNKEYYRNNGNDNFTFGRRTEDAYTESFFKTQNERFKAFSLDIEDDEFVRPSSEEFDLKTTYPGLVVGLGYGHGIKAVGEFKLGFYFDYTTGLPIIPGSSVKGTLRACFPNQKANKNYSQDALEAMEAKREFIKYLFFKAGLLETEARDLEIDAIEAEIFEGKSIENQRPIQLGTYERDVFFDAELVKGNNLRKVIGDDSITPHTAGPLRNPTPLLFMKILPNVTFRFGMDLQDSKVAPIVTKALKYRVFKEIISTMGIGAKTNVGYGRMK